MSYIRYELIDQVARLTIDRQDALNALNTQVLLDLEGALKQAQTEQARCIVITGAGDRAFVAGADVVRMSAMNRAEAQSFSELGNRVFMTVERLPIPSIAAVNGWALGGGCELALACDIRLASQKAVFGQPEVGLGITPGFGGTQRLARIVNLGAAKELIYTTRRIDADRALAVGLVNQVFAPEELLVGGELIARDRVREQGQLSAPFARSKPVKTQARGHGRQPSGQVVDLRLVCGAGTQPSGLHGVLGVLDRAKDPVGK